MTTPGLRTAVAAVVLAAQQAVAPYSGDCPCTDAGTFNFGDGQGCRQYTTVQDMATAAAGAAAAVQAATDCMNDVPCNVACYQVTDTRCSGEYQTEDETPARDATESFDSCAALDLNSNWPGNPLVPAKTAEQNCDQTPGCKSSSSSCVQDTRDIPALEALFTCSGVGTELVTSKSECDAKGSSCEWSNGPLMSPECADDDAPVMGCYPVTSTFCASHRDAIGRMVGSMGYTCPPPPPPPPTPSAGLTAIVSVAAVTLAGLAGLTASLL